MSDTQILPSIGLKGQSLVMKAVSLSVQLFVIHLLGVVPVAAAAAGGDQPSGPSSQAASAPKGHTGSGFVRPEPVEPHFEEPPGARTCRYELRETSTRLVDQEPFSQAEITLDYALSLWPDGRGELRVIRVRGKTRRKGYRAELDSARPGDLRRVRGGADTLLAPELVEAFALVPNVLRFELKKPNTIHLRATDAIRELYLNMHPPKPRAQKIHQAKVQHRLSDTALIAWFFPSYRVALPSQTGVHKNENAILERHGLRAVGFQAIRVQPKGPHQIVEFKEGYAPQGGIPGYPASSGGRFEKLAGLREATIELWRDHPCIHRGGEKLLTQMNWTPSTEGAETRRVDETRIRTWTPRS